MDGRVYPGFNHKTMVLYPTGIDTNGKPVYDRYIPKHSKDERVILTTYFPTDNFYSRFIVGPATH